jgi:hypothetical protein
MCDPEGSYTFSNGDEYRGSFRSCSKLIACKYGCFEGPGKLMIAGFGIFTGNFKGGKIHGSGRIEFLDGRDPVEQIWNEKSISEFI